MIRNPRSFVHCVVKVLKELFVVLLVMLSREPQRIHFFDTDFFHVGLALQDRHDFVDEFVQWSNLGI